MSTALITLDFRGHAIRREGEMLPDASNSRFCLPDGRKLTALEMSLVSDIEIARMAGGLFESFPLVMLRNKARKLLGDGTKPRATYVYIAQTSVRDRLKVGFSENVTKRVRSIGSAAGCVMELLGSYPGTRADERHAHHRLRSFRLEGEWFTLNARSLRIVRELLLRPAGGGTSRRSA